MAAIMVAMDNEDLANHVRILINEEGVHSLEWVTTFEACEHRIEEENCDILILASTLSGASADMVFDTMRQYKPELRCIFLIRGSEQAIPETMRLKNETQTWVELPLDEDRFYHELDSMTEDL